MSRLKDLVQSVMLLFVAVLLFLSLRWAFIEPFVIPSGSMIPTLLVNDHILVDKSAYGLHVPFVNQWIFFWKSPERGDVVVFRSTHDLDFLMIKRVIAVEGDRVSVAESGEVFVNGESLKQEAVAFDEVPIFESLNWKNLASTEDEAFFVKEDERYFTMMHKGALTVEQKEFEIPEGFIYLMGDNRNKSQDSRFFGAVPVENVLGKAKYIWLSCNQTLPRANFVCNPATLRWSRIFTTLK